MEAVAFENDHLNEMRQVGDEKVDRLVARVLGTKDAGDASGRLRYNTMLDLADRIVATPSLVIAAKSTLNQQLKALALLDPELPGYFTPMEAPDWVDDEKLALGAKLWNDNRLIMLGALYAYSLPACYLIEKGIPALYDTAKLREPRYLSQRIYETGLMLDAVMGERGIRVVTDIEEGGESARRYLWGDGFVTAKKVRFLHASMRYMLTHRGDASEHGGGEGAVNVAESLAREGGAWNSAELGVPVNQEDLAYTLLTFGYALPRGLERWGCSVSGEQRAAFLHLWRVVGHVMGIRDELTTDDWDEATRFYEFVKARQGRGSERGVALTRNLLTFLAAYMPSNEGLGNRLSALMIIDQLGEEDARKLLEPELVEAALKFHRRALYATGRGLVRGYYRIRRFVREGMPTLAAFLGNLIDGASDSLVDSWRGEYVRRPFYIPADAESWKQRAGVDETFMKTLRQWRRRLFVSLGGAVGLLFVAAFSFVALLPAWALRGETGLVWCGAACVAALIAAVAIMKWRLPAIFRSRPKLASVDAGPA